MEKWKGKEKDKGKGRGCSCSCGPTLPLKVPGTRASRWRNRGQSARERICRKSWAIYSSVLCRQIDEWTNTWMVILAVFPNVKKRSEWCNFFDCFYFFTLVYQGWYALLPHVVSRWRRFSGRLSGWLNSIFQGHLLSKESIPIYTITHELFHLFRPNIQNGLQYFCIVRKGLCLAWICNGITSCSVHVSGSAAILASWAR